MLSASSPVTAPLPDPVPMQQDPGCERDEQGVQLAHRSIATEVDPVVAGRQPSKTGSCMDDLARSVLLSQLLRKWEDTAMRGKV